MKLRFSFARFGLMLAAAGVLAFAQNNGNGNPKESDGNNGGGNDDKPIVHELNKQKPADAPTAGSTGPVTPRISNHGGPVMSTPVVYYIWYGNWNRNNGTDTPAGQTILINLAKNISGSPYFAINQSYGATGLVNYGGSTTDAYSQGTSLTDAKVKTVVTSAISAGKLPYNANGVYFVLTSSDVAESSGFCSQYCGWHTSGLATAGRIRYSFVGNAARCLSGCAAQSVSPNGNPGVDGMASVLAHELEEATSDPDLNAWYDTQGAENADKCAWTFGTTVATGNGSYYNMTLGTTKYLIQRNLYHTYSADYCRLQ